MEYVEEITNWIVNQEEYAPLIYILFHTLWIVCLLPSTYLEILPGYLFGFYKGWFVAVCGKTLGIYISLLLGRYLFQNTLKKYIFDKYPFAKALNKAISEQGFMLIMFIRATYTPMIIKNYGLSVIDLPLLTILFASFIPGVFFSLMWTIIGISSKNIKEIIQGDVNIFNIIPEDRIVLVFTSFLIFISLFLYFFYRFYKRFSIILQEIKNKNQ